MSAQGGARKALFERWLERYKEAWERRDSAAAKALFSPDARYQETPFDDEMRGAEAIAQYWERETSRQRDVHFSADLLAISGALAVAHWRASFFSESSSAAVTLDGVCAFELARDGRCLSFREWWHGHSSAADSDRGGHRSDG